MLQQLEGFTYASAIDLNMGYCHIKLDAESRKLCTIILSWGKYECNSLPMGLCNIPDVFQEKMNDLFVGMDKVRAYIDDLLLIYATPISPKVAISHLRNIFTFQFHSKLAHNISQHTATQF